MRVIKIGAGLAIFSGAMLSATTPAQSQAAGAGKTAFQACVACHGVKANDKRMGPTMFGIFGRKAGTQPGYQYSPALKGSNITWTRAELDAFLIAPRKKVPGTKMIYGGLADPKRRNAILDYLASLK